MRKCLPASDAASKPCVKEIAVGKLSGSHGHVRASGAGNRGIRLRQDGFRGLIRSRIRVVQRDRHASYATALALLAASIEKIATEIRHLQRTEVLEAEEFFLRRAKGFVGDAA
jgi:adenylosuccinate lyase